MPISIKLNFAGVNVICFVANMIKVTKTIEAAPENKPNSKFFPCECNDVTPTSLHFFFSFFKKIVTVKMTPRSWASISSKLGIGRSIETSTENSFVPNLANIKMMIGSMKIPAKMFISPKARIIFQPLRTWPSAFLNHFFMKNLPSIGSYFHII